ncbi:hypothetical protein IAD21_03198 [Abditibacteriota bacterium]|nr:hypothetical protein IAD21_03198 [Abditibacteriota bacterium]
MFSRTPFLLGITTALAATPGLAQLTVAPAAPATPSAPKPTRNELVNAASSGNLDRVKAIIASNPEFVSGTEAQSPLGAAVAAGQLEIARFLLEHGADPNSGGWNTTPLAQIMGRYDDKWKPLADLLAEKGADVNASDDSGQSLLQRALQNGNDRQKDRVVWLLDHGANIYAPSRGGGSALDSAIATSSTDTLKLILAKADIKRRDDIGQTPLFSAVRTGKIDPIRALLERGAEVNAQNAYGDTPLHIAARGDGSGTPNSEVLKALLDAGANANLPNARGDLPLHIALRRDVALDRTFNTQTGDYMAPANPNAIPRGLQLAPLIDKSNIDTRDGGGFSPLLLTITTRDAESRDLIRDRTPKNDSTTDLFDAVAGGESLKVAQILKLKPYLAFFRLPDGSTPLHIAALWGTLGSAQELVKRGADLNARDARGLTPLHYALRNPTGRFARRSINMAEFLLGKGANPNIATPTGDAPLHLAARAGDAELITLLLDKGALINARGVGGETALLILTNKSTNISLYKTLITRGADVNAGNISGGTASDPYGTRYLNSGFGFGSSVRYSSYAVSGVGMTPLHRAVVAQRPDMMTALLEKGAKLEALESSGKTPLALAISASGYNGNTEGASDVVSLLLSKGADPTVKIERGDLLSFAVERGNADLVRTLLATKKFSFQSKTPRTPLLFSAVSNGRVEVVRALLEAGANPNETDANGRTLLQAAYSDEIKKLLTERITQLQGGNTTPATPATVTPATRPRQDGGIVGGF